MPEIDIQQCKIAWERTQTLIREGDIVQKIVNDKRYSNFPKKLFNGICQVRPHAKKRTDTYPLPVPDKMLGLDDYPKHCFWLNRGYVMDKIYKL